MTLNPPEPKTRGRPRDPERVRRVLQAAREQFNERGFERTSMDSIAEASGISKMTIYSYFPSKEALFEAMIDHRTDSVFDLWSVDTMDASNPERVLKRIGTEFLRLMRADDVIGQHRAVFAAADHQSNACLGFYRQGPRKLIDMVADYLRAAHKAGTLVVPKPELAADQFLALFHGDGHIRSLLGIGKPKAKEDGELVRENVKMFIRAYGAADKRR